jgi:DNA-binding response OmpR family regulator
LVVEDEPAIAELVAYNLEQDGYEVAMVHDGVAASEALSSFRPDLVVLDLLLPLKSGWQVLRQMRGNSDPAIAATPAIVVSALGGERLARELAACGAPHVLGKPFSVMELRDLVARLLDSPDERRSAHA